MATEAPADHHGVLVAGRSAEIEAFFGTLRSEQTRFLHAVGQASAQLPRRSSQLACLAATQSRLTRQFFDAQRSLLLRRAEVDAEVDRIGEDAESDAVAVAASRAASGAPVAAEGHEERATVRAGAHHARTSRSFGSTRDAEVLARAIDDVFETDEPHGALAQQQLACLLDSWWDAANQEGRAVLDDAHARAAMRRHLATIEGDDVRPAPSHAVEVVERPAPVDRANALHPSQVLAALDDVEPAGLEALLATLADALGGSSDDAGSPEAPQDAPSADPSPRRDLVIRVDRLDDPSPTGAGQGDEAFQQFWSTPPVANERRRRAGWFPFKAVVAMTATTSLLTALMAWIG